MADPKHDIARIVAPVAASPALDLCLEIGSGLTGERRIGRPHTFAGRTVTARTGDDSALRVAIQEQAGRDRRWSGRQPHRHRSVKARHLKPLSSAQLPGDPAHFRLRAASVGKCFELPLKVACIESREPRGTAAIAFAAQSVAREAGAGGTRAPAAQRNELARFRQPIARPRVQLRAPGQQRGSDREREEVQGHRWIGTGTAKRRFPLAMSVASAVVLCAAACKPPPEQTQSFPTASAKRGKELIQRVGCASCHTISGIDWPKGRAAPELRGLEGRALIAGRVPNHPDILASFVRNAPAVAPGTTMPPMPLSERDSRDVAAYLYEMGS